MKYVENFNEWALEKYHQFEKVYKLRPDLTYEISTLNRTTAIIDMKNGKASFSKCSKCDEFNANIGLGIAWARYIGVEIPKQITFVKISELNPGQRFIFADRYKTEFYYIGQNPIHNTSIAVNTISGECYQFNKNLSVIKI